MGVKLKNGFTAEFSLGPRGLSDFKCEWSPRVPTTKEFLADEPGYRAARDSFLSAEADALGMEMIPFGPGGLAVGFRKKTTHAAEIVADISEMDCAKWGEGKKTRLT